MKLMNGLRQLVVCVLLSSGLGASAQTPRTWIGGTSTDWFEAANWEGGAAPETFDPVAISGATVNLTHTPPVLGSLTLSAAATLNLYAQPTNGLAPWGLELAVSGTVSLAGNSWINPYSNPTNGGSPVLYCSNLTVGAACGFNANGKGYAGGYRSQAGFGPGRSLGVSAGHSGGAGYGGWGGKGGNSAGGATYGDYTNPAEPGSGAGGRTAYNNESDRGTAGGGLIRVIAADSVLVDGSLLANGLNKTGNVYPGAGSGGGVYVQCRTFGGTGVVSAVGGDSDRRLTTADASGGGGGGRIAVVYDTAAQSALLVQPAVTFNAAGGQQNSVSMSVISTHTSLGGPGTIYFSDNQFFDWSRIRGGEIKVPGVSALSTNALTLATGVIAFPPGFELTVSGDVTLTGAGGIDFTNAAVTIGGKLVINSDYRTSAVFRGGPDQQLTVGSGITATKGWLEIHQQGMEEPVLTVPGNLSLDQARLYVHASPAKAGLLEVAGNISLTNGATAELQGGMTSAPAESGLLIAVTGDITLAPNCWIYPCSHPTNGGSVHFQANSISALPNGGIDASARGFRGGYQSEWGYGPGGTQGTTGRRPGGAGYGGRGGTTSLRAGGGTYGDALHPVQPGSGAGGVKAYNDSRDWGSNGGGLIRLVATDTVLVDGSLLANGGDLGGGAYPACGSGGGIYVRCKTFAGKGTLSARGGNQGRNAADAGGSGGGGRIAVWSSRPIEGWTGTTNVVAGTAFYYPGEGGTSGFLMIPPLGTMVLIK